ncbi:MBL fold metallo-hydrolase [Haloprofundus salilacus]|uniref:MBL fold metallo-hydrolase n=1 Tax=Haloprofundus salilacus TaxID=2876190 RepID=UPI001CCD26F6|nr:MBL fold metallo-hydrolase [Haloprofundus salilacus]
MSPPSDTTWRVPLRGVNAYLVDAEGLTLVDAGTPMDAARLCEYVERAGYSLAEVERVLLTHYDIDHVGALAGLAEMGLDAPVYASEPDASFLLGEAKPPLGNHKGALQRALGAFVDAPDLSVERIVDGDAVGPFVAYRTPGHTPGHTSFVHREYGLALVGDLVRGDDGRFGRLPSALAYDADRNDESIRQLADHLDGVEVVGMGHGDPVRSDGGRRFREFAESL